MRKLGIPLKENSGEKTRLEAAGVQGTFPTEKKTQKKILSAFTGNRTPDPWNGVVSVTSMLTTEPTPLFEPVKKCDNCYLKYLVFGNS